MPNHVMNVLKMKGITTLPLFTQDDLEGQMFDFNKIIPMPESLQVDAGTIEGLAMEAVLRKLSVPQSVMPTIRVTPTMSDDEYQRLMTTVKKSEEELCKLGLVYISNKALHGATSWYSWCCSNWGTKWNSNHNKKRDEDTITFETAWCPPLPVTAQLAQMYPDAKIEHWWAGENAGNISGYVKCESGKSSIEYHEYGSSAAYQNYVFCWGKSKCLYQDDNGLWFHKDCNECQGC